jgi:hypothetical protein
MLTFTVIGILAVISYPTIGKVVRTATVSPVPTNCEEPDEAGLSEKVPVRVVDRSDREA